MLKGFRFLAARFASAQVWRGPVERGASMVELAIVMPFLLLLTSSGYEYSRMVRVSELTSTLAREVAARTFRECIVGIRSLPPSADIDTAENQCVALSSSNLIAGSMPNVPEGAIVVSIYDWDSGASTAVQKRFGKGCNIVSNPPPFDCSALASKYDAARVNAELGSVVQAAGRLVIAEVFAADDPLFNIVPISASLENGLHYSASIY